MDLLWAALSTTNGLLSAIGLVLLAICLIAWKRGSIAEATPNADQIEQIRHFVEGYFARYVARGLATEGIDPAAVDVSHDPAWRRVFMQHLRLNSELYAFRPSVAMRIFTESIDAAVRHELEQLRAGSAAADEASVGAR